MKRNWTTGHRDDARDGGIAVVCRACKKKPPDDHGERRSPTRSARSRPGRDARLAAVDLSSRRSVTSRGDPAGRRGDQPRGYLKDAFFDYNKSDLRDDARTALSANADWLKKHPNLAVPDRRTLRRPRHDGVQPRARRPPRQRRARLPRLARRRRAPASARSPTARSAPSAPRRRKTAGSRTAAPTSCSRPKHDDPSPALPSTAAAVSLSARPRAARCRGGGMRLVVRHRRPAPADERHRDADPGPRAQVVEQGRGREAQHERRAADDTAPEEQRGHGREVERADGQDGAARGEARGHQPPSLAALAADRRDAGRARAAARRQRLLVASPPAGSTAPARAPDGRGRSPPRPAVAPDTAVVRPSGPAGGGPSGARPSSTTRRTATTGRAGTRSPSRASRSTSTRTRTPT